MTAPAAPCLFDRALLAQRQTRARVQARDGAPRPDFLLQHSASDLTERLGAILRVFDRALDLGTPDSAFIDVLRARPGVGLALSAGWATGTTARDIVADEEALPFADARFDLVVSGLSLQTVNDLPGTLAQIRRALRPDGLFLAALLGGRTLHELRSAFMQAESELTGGASPRVAPFADIRDLGGLLQRAGFALPVADLDTVTVRYADMFGLMRDLRAMAATNCLTARSRRPLTRAVLLRAAEVYAAQFADADGRIRATFEIVWLAGWAPHASQQQPLKPGSAKARLADALGAAELVAGEKATR